MLSSWKPSDGTTICLDASFVVRLLESEQPSAEPLRLWRHWQQTGQRLVAPTLLYYEVSNALYKYVRQKTLSSATAQQLMENALHLDIDLVTYPELHQDALRLAHEWGLPATYDAHYLALARAMNAAFWTADRRLAQRARPHYAHVHLLGEA